MAEGNDRRGPSRRPAMAGAEYRAWIGFWGRLLILGILAMVGAFFASRAGAEGDYTCGLTLSLAALALAFLLLKHRLDGGTGDWQSFLLVDNPASLAIVIPLFAILGLAGLFVAAGSAYGSLYDAGIGLFLASGFIVFFSLKRVFDKLESRC